MHFQTKYLLYFAGYQLAICAIYSQFSAYADLISKLNSLLYSFMEKNHKFKNDIINDNILLEIFVSGPS
jgi:hypothetical protein